MLWSLLVTAVIFWIVFPLHLRFWHIVGAFVASWVVVTLSMMLADDVLPDLVRIRWRLWIREMQHIGVRHAAPAGPIHLYLRPFDADFASALIPAHQYQDVDDLAGFDDDGYPIVTGLQSRSRSVHFERWLRVCLLPWGRLVALANPSETRNLSSAVHIVTDDDHWRGVVEHLCRHAKLIVCMVPTERFVGAEPMLDGPMPSFSRDASYASFFAELRHLSEAGHMGKLLLVIPEANMTAEKWSRLRANLAGVGISVPSDPATVDGHAHSGLGLFVIDEDGHSRIHYWLRTFAAQKDWNAKIWRVNVKILEKLLGRTAPRWRLVLALAEQRWLLGPSLGQIGRAINRSKQRKPQ